MATEMTTREAARTLSEAINRVRYGGERLVLTRHGRRIAAIVPLEDLPPADRTIALVPDDRRDD